MTTASPGGNPQTTLHRPPVAGRLHTADALAFRDLLQAGRLAANASARAYPHVTTAAQLDRAQDRPRPGHLVLAHLSALMYSRWDRAPGGPSVFDLAHRHLDEPRRAALRAEAFAWGARRVRPPPGDAFVLVADSPAGSVVADHALRTFYLVLGVRASPAQAFVQQQQLQQQQPGPDGVAVAPATDSHADAAAVAAVLPCRVRLTALPFRGALVCDGVLPGAGLFPPLSAAEADAVMRNYARARDAGQIVTGLHVPAADVLPPPPPSLRCVRELDEVSVRVFVQVRGGNSQKSLAAVRREAERMRNVPPCMKPLPAVGAVEQPKRCAEEQTLLRQVPPAVFAAIRNFGLEFNH